MTELRRWDVDEVNGAHVAHDGDFYRVEDVAVELAELPGLRAKAAAFDWMNERTWLELRELSHGWRVWDSVSLESLGEGATPLATVQDAMRREGGGDV